MRRRSKFMTFTAALLLAAGLTAALAAPSNATGTGNQWHYGNGYLNAWSGGPWVKVYIAGGTSNNDFTLISNAGGWQLEFTGNGSSGGCIGDAFNDPGNAETSLDACGGSFGGSAGWGTLFDVSQPCGRGSYAFQNRHWTSQTKVNEWLGPPNPFTEGNPWFLNWANTEYCFTFAPPA